MSRIHILGAVTALAFLAAPAVALAAQPDPTATPNSAAPAMAAPSGAMSSTPSASDAGVNTNGVTMTADQMPPGQARALAAGDNKLVTNGPVPDTPANRAKYGKPMSHGGQKTPPAGN